MISTDFLKQQFKPIIHNIALLPQNEVTRDNIDKIKDPLAKCIVVTDSNAPIGIISIEDYTNNYYTEKPQELTDIINKNFCIIDYDELNLQVYQDNTNDYALIYDDDNYIGIVDLKNNIDYYETFIGEVSSVIDMLLDTTHNGVIALDSERKLILMNKKAVEIYGADDIDFLDKPVSDTFPSSPLNKFLFEESQVGVQLKVNGRYVTANRTPLKIGDRTVGGISIFQDITEDVTASQELESVKENEIYLESIIDNSYDGIYITDSAGLTLKVNKSYERITGISKEKLIGHYVEDLANEGLLSVYLTDRVVKEKAAITINQKVNNKMLTITGNPIFDVNGKVSKVITNVRDITDILNLEKQLRISQEMANLYKQEMFDEVGNDNIVYKSESMQKVFHLAKKIAPRNSTALLLGETGVGKEVVAKYIHTNSSRADKNYIKINCGAIPANLLESELFGYVGGAFTGANPKGKMGMFELANEGTLFLDEIGELPINLQASLLRVLQDNEVTRVGDTKSRKVDVRIIAATNKNLEEMIDKGEFRSDLFYRLNVISIYIPPLRKRLDDINDFAELFVNDLNKKYGEKKVFTQEFIDNLKSREWPGNVRELANFIEKQYVMNDADVLNDFVTLDQSSGSPSEINEGQISVKGIVPLNDAVKEVEKTLIKRAMDKVKNTHKAAKMLGMSQPTFFRKYKEYKNDDDEQEN